MNNLKNLLFLSVALFFFSCVQETFAPETSVTPQMAQPRDLKYATLIHAYEKGMITSNMPTVETGGLIPQYEIVAGYDGEGNVLDQNFMDFVSINNPYDVTLENGTVSNYRNAGRVVVKSGHPFIYDGGEYSFDIAVKTTLNDKEYRTVFEKVFKFTCLPNLPSKMLFIPSGQNLVVGSDKVSTNEPSLGVDKTNFRIYLTTCTDIFECNPETGVLTLKDDVTVTENTQYEPKFKVENIISGESKEIETSLIIVVSNEPVEMPLQTNYFFAPIFGSDVSDYKTVTITAGKPSSLWTAKNADITAIKANFPYETTSMPPVQLIITGTDKTSKAHESWFILKSQDLSPFSFGFDLKAEFWLSTNYVTYDFFTGLPCSSLTPYISTTYDFDSDVIDESQWTDISGNIVYNIYDAKGVLKTASQDLIPNMMPYPGDHRVLTNTNIDGVTAVDNYQDFKNVNYLWKFPMWMKCELDLNPYKDLKNVTIAFRGKCEKDYQNILNDDNTTYTFQRGGSYYLDGVVFSAKEKE